MLECGGIDDSMAQEKSLKGRLKKGVFFLIVGLAVGGLLLGLSLKLLPSDAQITEISVEVEEIERLGNGTWSVSKKGVIKESGHPEPFVVRLKHLRAHRLQVEVVGESEGRLLLRSDDLQPGDLVVLKPGEIQSGQAVTPREGLDEKRLIHLTLEAGMASAVAEDLDESVRFLSPRYRDNVGFDNPLMRGLLEEAYDRFEEPRVELAGPPKIQVDGDHAIVRADIRVTAKYLGYRNFLLGDQDGPNRVQILMDKSTGGWKVSRIEGLRPLGFDQNYLKLLGAQVGVPLTVEEQVEKQQFCMPCRQRMAQRFAPVSQ
jgi:hypothetical protein